MKKYLLIIVAAAMLLSLVPATLVSAHPEGIIDGDKVTELENGKHYTLNIIGVKNDKGKNSNMGNIIEEVNTGGNGNVIFVDMEGKVKINLMEGDDFAVLDKNGTDGTATFQLPDPDLDAYIVGQDGMEEVDTDSAYSVFVRPLGKPGGKSTITTCANVTELFGSWLAKDDYKIINEVAELGGYASIEQVGQLMTERKTGKSVFTNVTAELLTIVFAVELYEYNETTQQNEYVETVYVRVPIFDDMLQYSYWEYNNDNLKVLQVRFYPVSTDVTYADAALPDLPQEPVE
jgi:hypothetical protein